MAEPCRKLLGLAGCRVPVVVAIKIAGVVVVFVLGLGYRLLRMGRDQGRP
jgi:hypothetical protein